MPPLDLSYLNAAVVTVPDFKQLNIILAGAGGTGAYLAQHLGRMMRVMYESEKGIHMTIADPDIVKSENIGRQLFCPAEEGRPKAEALAVRYGHAWGLNVSSYVGEYHEGLLLGAEMTLLVGCVDNPAGRRALAETLKNNPLEPGPDNPPRIWYLDCGNFRNTGRVLLGSAYEYDQVKGAFADKDHCYALPGPILQSPGLLKLEPEDTPNNNLTCAQAAAANLQSLNINSRIASEAADFITQLLVTRTLKQFAWDVNLSTRTTRPYHVTAEEVARALGKPVGFVQARPQGAAA